MAKFQKLCESPPGATTSGNEFSWTVLNLVGLRELAKSPPPPSVTARDRNLYNNRPKHPIRNIFGIPSNPSKGSNLVPSLPTTVTTHVNTRYQSVDTDESGGLLYENSFLCQTAATTAAQGVNYLSFSPVIPSVNIPPELPSSDASSPSLSIPPPPPPSPFDSHEIISSRSVFTPMNSSSPIDFSTPVNAFDDICISQMDDASLLPAVSSPYHLSGSEQHTVEISSSHSGSLPLGNHIPQLSSPLEYDIPSILHHAKRWQNLNIVLPIYPPSSTIVVVSKNHTGENAFVFPDTMPGAQLLFSTAGHVCDTWATNMRLRVAVVHKCPEFLVPKVVEIFNRVLKNMNKFTVPIMLRCTGLVKHTIRLRSSSAVTYRYDTIGQLQSPQDHHRMALLIQTLQQVLYEINMRLVDDARRVLTAVHDIISRTKLTGGSSISSIASAELLNATRCGLEFRFSPCKDLKVAVREGNPCAWNAIDRLVGGGAAVTPWASQFVVEDVALCGIRIERDKATETQIEPCYLPSHRLSTRSMVRDVDGALALVSLLEGNQESRYLPKVDNGNYSNALHAAYAIYGATHCQLARMVPDTIKNLVQYIPPVDSPLGAVPKKCLVNRFHGQSFWHQDNPSHPTSASENQKSDSTGGYAMTTVCADTAPETIHAGADSSTSTVGISCGNSLPWSYLPDNHYSVGNSHNGGSLRDLVGAKGKTIRGNRPTTGSTATSSAEHNVYTSGSKEEDWRLEICDEKNPIVSGSAGIAPAAEMKGSENNETVEELAGEALRGLVALQKIASLLGMNHYSSYPSPTTAYITSTFPLGDSLRPPPSSNSPQRNATMDDTFGTAICTDISSTVPIIPREEDDDNNNNNSYGKIVPCANMRSGLAITKSTATPYTQSLITNCALERDKIFGGFFPDRTTSASATSKDGDAFDVAVDPFTFCFQEPAGGVAD